MYKNIGVEHAPGADKAYVAVSRILKREIEKRSPARVGGAGDFTIKLGINDMIGGEGFEIKAGAEGEVNITGGDALGLIYGAGKFLRGSDYSDGGFAPSCWTGVSLPEKEIRGVYLATHFYNYYHAAPIGEIRRYLEELALWGANTIQVWFDMHHYTGTGDPEAIKMIERLTDILSYAKELGLKICFVAVANEAYAASPPSLRADWTAGHDGYVRTLVGHYHLELCPNKAGGLELILKWRREMLESFAALNPDYIIYFPYDQGGCTCPECRPWGANGYIKTCKALSALTKSVIPGAKIGIHTWLFDSFTTGEWDALAELFKEKPDWCDFLCAEFMSNNLNPKLPEKIRRDGVPGGLPLVGFPEISMYGAVPWGGFGANPIPGIAANIMKEESEFKIGGIMYSEGIYEDINKILCLRLYWDRNNKIEDILREYLKYEFGAAPEELTEAIGIFERTIARNRVDENGAIHNYPDAHIPWKGEQRFIINDTEGIDRAFSIATAADGALPEWARRSWRWRIFYLRAAIDRELYHSDFKTNETIEKAYEELTSIYHAGNAVYCVAPPTLDSIAQNRGDFHWV